MKATRLALLSVWVILLAATVGATSGASDKLVSPSSELQIVFDMRHHKLVVRQAGVVVRDYPVTSLSGDTSGAKNGEGGSLSETDSQAVSSVQLISAAEVIPVSELEIIAEENGLSPVQLQRYTPREMIIVTNENLRIYVESDCPGAKVFFWPRALDVLRRIWYGLLGGDSMRIRISAADAMSLYGVALSNPTIIIAR